jgi:hypothetical protein
MACSGTALLFFTSNILCKSKRTFKCGVLLVKNVSSVGHLCKMFNLLGVSLGIRICAFRVYRPGENSCGVGRMGVLVTTGP